MSRCQTCRREINYGHVDHQDPKPQEKKLKPPSKYRSKTYETLPKKRGYIRLLNLRGSSPENPLVECELIIKAIDKSNEFGDQKNEINQTYEALSWCVSNTRSILFPTLSTFACAKPSSSYRESLKSLES